MVYLNFFKETLVCYEFYTHVKIISERNVDLNITSSES